MGGNKDLFKGENNDSNANQNLTGVHGYTKRILVEIIGNRKNGGLSALAHNFSIC